MDASQKTKAPSETAPLKGWRPMCTAPRDGTMILVCETPNGEHWNVMPAAYQMHMGDARMEGFWGVWTTSRLPLHLAQQRDLVVRDNNLPVDFKAIAMTPLCWQPMPESESPQKLRRRASQVYAAKARARKAVVPLPTGPSPQA